MGNKGSKNDDFSQNANFNMVQHAQAMRHLQANYTNANVQLNTNIRRAPQVVQSEFKAIHRTVSIYKPSINLHAEIGSLTVSFDYDSDEHSHLQIFIEVKKVNEDLQSKITTSIDSSMFYEEYLAPGKKVKFSKEYRLNGQVKVIGSTVILRVGSLKAQERTQYSIKNTGGSHWKILLQKLEYEGQVTQLDNIYKGGSDCDECIICFTQKANTLIIPCNHLCVCWQCCDHLKRSTNTCPICRSDITSFKRIKQSE